MTRTKSFAICLTVVVTTLLVSRPDVSIRGLLAIAVLMACPLLIDWLMTPAKVKP